MAAPRPLEPGLTLHLLVETSRLVAASSSLHGKVRALADCLAAMPPGELGIAVSYLSGVLPQGRMGIRRNALQSAATRTPSATAHLTLTAVDNLLRSVDAMRGPGSAAGREGLLARLFAAATEQEQQFLFRLITGELRQGALDGLMVEAIAAAARLPAEIVRGAAMYASGLGALATVALAEGEAGLSQFRMRLFHPVAPMLAQTAAGVAEALRDLRAPVQFEWKMDGARIQVHKRGREVRIYTRALNEMGAAIPEIIAAARALPVEEVVLDGEALSHAQNGRPHAFQVTMRRFGRRLNVEALLEELPMRAYYFDCLLLDGQALAERPMSERMQALDTVVPLEARIPRLVTDDVDTAIEFYEAALAAGHEGVMAKSLAAPYEAGNRGASWLKIKRAHTLDLVILAAEWGNGRRAGRLSNLHLGALDSATGEYVMLGKTFKGLTDAMLAWQTAELLAREIRRDASTVHVRPELVVEIAFSDLQASTRYEGGLALRLARVKRYREDKSAAEADTMESVRRIHAAQG